MTVMDLIRFSGGAVWAHRLRSILSLIGIAIGIGAVILLTAIGEGTRYFVLAQFTQFGTNILAINPGKTKTLGIPGILGGTTHKLTLEDADALSRIPGVEAVVPMVMGMGRVEAEGRGRSVNVFGVTADMPAVWRFTIGQGEFLPIGDLDRAASVAVLGPKMKRELFGDQNPLGENIRIAGYRFRVIGVMEPKGQILGLDLDDAVYVPVANAMRMFNLDELMEVDVAYQSAQMVDRVVEAVRQILIDRHHGTEDFSITTQAAMLEALDEIMRIVTLAAAGIAGISLVVGAIGILTMMWISVGERISEIGLLRAIGAKPRQIFLIFILEAVMLSVLGGALGVSLGVLGAFSLTLVLPGLPVFVDEQYLVVGLLVAMGTGLLSGVAPARRALLIDPIEALHVD
ncbi:MAG: ABC transporter permease [Nitrospirota bacterium]|nr:MAG: ABC transporter permease [Nitrospirota bacterium]